MSAALNPFLYFRRNLGKTLPMTFVVMNTVVLVASVITIINSIDLTVYTLYGYNRFMTGLTPRNALVIADEEAAKIRPLRELGALCPVRTYQTNIKTIFGKLPFALFGLEPSGRDLLIQRCGVHIVQGRLPADGQPEAAVSVEIAQNLGLKVGDTISRPESEDSYAPVPIRLVGLLDGPVWLGLVSKALIDTYSPFSASGYLAFARSPAESAQRRLDDAILRVVDKGKVRVWRFGGLVRETQSALSNLYLILNIIVTIIVFAVSFVCGLLANIYFTQRLPEVATLSAIGYPRAVLLRRALGETSLLCLLGWLLGALLSIGVLLAVRALFLTPKGLILDPFDYRAYLFTLPLPITITVCAVLTIWGRLSTLDPVSIIERRG